MQFSTNIVPFFTPGPTLMWPFNPKGSILSLSNALHRLHFVFIDALCLSCALLNIVVALLLFYALVTAKCAFPSNHCLLLRPYCFARKVCFLAHYVPFSVPNKP